MKKVRPKEALISVDSPDKYHGMLLKTVSYCYDANTHVKIDPSLYQIFTGQMRTLPVWGAPLIVISPQLLKPWQVFLKRITDIIFSLLVIVLGLPFWVVVALIVKLGSKGPVFYAQERVGKGSKNFMMYKFRSMTQDAEKSGPQWAKVNDPRVTPFGRFLRKSHLDEVPQFWNVLKGDMSLVGPRPERPVFVEKFSKIFPQYKRRLILRPGLTGWWQIHYTTYSESDEEIQNRLKDDFYYIENISFKLDLEIMLRTVFAVLKGHGHSIGFIMKTIIVIPTYNEIENIDKIIDAVFTIQPDIHILIVDDSSPDGTADAVRKLQENDERLHLIVREGKMGLALPM